LLIGIIGVIRIVALACTIVRKVHVMQCDDVLRSPLHLQVLTVHCVKPRPHFMANYERSAQWRAEVWWCLGRLLDWMPSFQILVLSSGV